ncbi:hypothetical protein CVT25_011718 [Psilocybe cyanescens]|uniref:Protein kinase domain-containing protein n=1 Tax=Psilocybe cyanescens TaxID=93625 RepID=A0A409WID5_PSICY|nr:hypothetical protein CVT25_011718 [Psilocybe cyanescens]
MPSSSNDTPELDWDSYYLELDALGRYFLSHFLQSGSVRRHWPKLTRALRQMTQEGFLDFCSDVMEEMYRRNNDLRDGTVFFLPSHDDMSLGRNHTRRKLASIDCDHFHNLCINVCYEIGRRSSKEAIPENTPKYPYSCSRDSHDDVGMAASVERARLLDNYHPYRDDLDRQLTESLCDRFTAITSVIYSLFVSIFQDRHRYDALLSYRGDSAQQILDLLQMLLDYPAAGSAAKKSLLVTLARLSSKSGLHPRCFILTGILRGKSPLASGSFGDIWKGDFNGQPVCLKIIKMYESSNKDKWLKAFSKEAVLWSQISHPNVLPFYGIFHLDEVHGRICLVSPWMDRGNINEYLSQNPDVPRLLLTSDIAHGLSYLHEQGIIHGDIKGANILVTESGRACLADFGLSRIQGAAELSESSSGSSSFQGGTTRWQAPELLDPEVDSPRLTMESDVYAYACVLYEIYVGKVPFHEYIRDVTVILQIGKGRKPTRPPSESLSFSKWGLTGQIWSLMERCWSKDPTKRPTIFQILSDIVDPGLILADPRPVDDWEQRSASRFRNSIYRSDRLSINVLETVLSWVSR